MRLVQIRLAGFKSFVDPTSIHVPGQLVGVVGPNGCGKSNVIDAGRWVLGESRAAALRGDSMQDVIFNGSVNRTPLARASVELIFDNAQGRAAGQWSQYAEISVKRILQRDGESSYYINGAHVRRRDITDMFLGTGLGPRAYAIVEQGMISRVIEAKPEELRVFLEEAAGISKYKERRRETESRLADTRGNLARITDIRTELAAQLEKLQAQATVATRYKEYHSELQLRQQLLWYARRRDAAAERERQALEMSRVGNELEAENAQLRQLESRVETARAAHYRCGDGLNGAQAALYAANAEVARFESELRHVEETRQRLEGQHTERLAQLGSWREQRAQLTQALHMWAARAGDARQRSAEAQAKRGGENARLPQAEQAFRASQERLSETRRELLQAESRLQLEQDNLSHLERGAQALQQRRERLESELQTLAEPDAAAANALRERIAALEAAVQAAQAGHESLQAECAALEERSAAAGEALGAAQREHAAAEAQLATLRQIQAAAEDNAPLREWLERHGLGALPRLWQKLRIDRGWETAVESVLRERLHALELSEATRLQSVLADRPPAKASLFARGNSPGAPGAPGYEPLASKIRAVDPAVSGALADWLAGAYAAEESPDAARQADLPPGAVLVDRDGHQFTRHTVSFHAPDQADAGLLARQSAIEALDAGCRDLQQKVGAAQDAHRQLESEAAERIAAEIATLREKLEAVRGGHLAAETALAEQRRAVQQAERDAQDALFGERECGSKIAEIDNSVRVIDQQIERAELEVAKLTEELAADPIPAVRHGLDAAVESRLGCETTLAAARNAVEGAAGALRELEEGRLQSEAKVAPLRERLGELRLKEQAAQINFDQFAAQLREANADEERLSREAERAPRPAALQGEITRLAQAITDLGAVNLAALDELRSSQERKGFLDSQAADLEEAGHTLEDAIRRIDRETRELLRETFDSVNRHFGSLFPTLFGGGEAKLIMTG